MKQRILQTRFVPELPERVTIGIQACVLFPIGVSAHVAHPNVETRISHHETYNRVVNFWSRLPLSFVVTEFVNLAR